MRPYRFMARSLYAEIESLTWLLGAARAGYPSHMDAEIQVDSVDRSETRRGNTRWVVRDADGREYTTFRPRIGEKAEGFRGKPAHVDFHEEDRDGYRNVYLDAIGPSSEAPARDAGAGDSDPDEAAWNTAVEAAPWLLGTSEPDQALEPDELYRKLAPFKQRVSEDIRRYGRGGE
jgi:hypothetical protein